MKKPLKIVFFDIFVFIIYDYKATLLFIALSQLEYVRSKYITGMTRVFALVSVICMARYPTLEYLQPSDSLYTCFLLY